MVTRRGDNIPTIKDYAHWGEEAGRVWYEENKYDMEHSDEIIEDDDDFQEPDGDEMLNHRDAEYGHSLTLKSVDPWLFHEKETYSVKELNEAAIKIRAVETFSHVLLQAAIDRTNRKAKGR